MLKKIVLATGMFLLATSSIAFADSGYIGGVVGTDIGQAKVTVPAIITAELGMEGFAGGLYGGYRFDFDQFNVAGEIFANASSTDATTTLIGLGTVKTGMKYTYGIAALPGVKLTDETNAFVRVGFVRGRFEETGTLLPGTVRQDLNGFQLGSGLDTMLTENLSMRGEYVYNHFQSKTIAGVKYQPTTSQFNMGVSWHFL